MNALGQEASKPELADAVRAMRVRLERAAGLAVSAAVGGATHDLGDAESKETASSSEASYAALPLQLLAKRFGLSHFEQELLLLCLTWELDTRAPALCGAVQGDPRKAYPTFGLALSLSVEPVWEALSPERPLRRWQLLELQPTHLEPLIAWPLRVDERVLSFVKGAEHLDARWMSLLEPMDSQPMAALPSSQRAVIEQLVAGLRSAGSQGRLPIVQLSARERRLAGQVALEVAHAFGLQLYRLEPALLPTTHAELDLLLRLWQRETLLGPAALFVDTYAMPDVAASVLERFAARVAGLVLVAGREPRELSGRDCLRFDVQRPTADERRSVWLHCLATLPAERASSLAGQFILDASQIEQVVTQLPEAEREQPEALWRACVAATVPRLEGLAHRIEPRAGWDDLVLAPEELRTLHEMAAQVQHRTTVYEDWGFSARTQRGLALSALFAGESGTGKTLAAEVLARELRVPLLCIDLSAVVDKYIGETEKNLRRVFDAAEDSGALLFFDEADALFGKRSEVKDAHDRFANIEINYLLQRMEAYRGLAVLATNMKSALDTAFMRRLRFYVRFAFPAERERRTIWRRVFPSLTPLAALDYERLGQFVLTGASIRSIAMNAAFLAAQANGQVTMALLLDAVRSELRKLDQRVNESHFREASLPGACLLDGVRR